MVKHRRWLFVLALVAVLIGIRAALPEALQWYVNRTLDETPEYDGVVGDIDLSLIAGQYRINAIRIVKVTEEVPVPLFAAEAVELSVLWSGLLDGAFVGEMVLYRPSLNVVDGEEARQTGVEGDWTRVLDELFPLRIDRVAVHEGEFHFRNFEREPQVDVSISDITAEVTNLTNRERLGDSMVAVLDLRGRALEQGSLAVYAKLNPSLTEPAFDIDARLMDVPVTRLNDFARAYANLDAEAGSLDVALELATLEGRLEGYVKPVIHDLKVFKLEDDAKEADNPLQFLWEGLVALVTEVLENQPEDQFATSVPISGSLENVETGAWEAIGNVLQNAFVEAFQSTLDNTVNIDLGAGDEDGGNATEETADE